MSQSTDTGKLLAQYIKSKRIGQAALARAIGVKAATLAYYLKNPSIQSKTLWAICHALKHNFFMDIAQQLPSSYSSGTNIFEAKNQEIEKLKRRIEILEAEKAVLLESKR